MWDVTEYAGTSGAVRLAVVLAVSALLVHTMRHDVRWPAVLRQLVIVISAFLLYFLVRGLTEGSTQQAIANGWRVVDFEKAVGLFQEDRVQEAIVGHQSLVDIVNWIYIWGHWPVIAAVAIWLLFRHEPTFIVYRNAFLVSGVIGLVIFATFPVAPPRLMPLDLVDTVTEHSNSYRVLQPPSLVNQYAAVPSLHFGWNLLIGIALVQCAASPGAKVFGVAMPALMAFAVVATANHYIIDAILGAAVALFGLWFAHSLPWMTAKWQAITGDGSRTDTAGSRPE